VAGSVQKTLASGNTGYTIDLSTLSDGTVTESMLITDAAGNTKTVTGTLVSGTTLKLDTTADAGTAATLVVNGTSDDVINNSEKTAVAFTVAGLDSDVTTGGSAVVTFTSSGGGSVQKTPWPAATQATR